MKRYRFIIGDNLMYNATHIRRVRWYNFFFVRSGMVNVLEWSDYEANAEVAEKFARLYFSNRGRVPNIMGHEL